MTNYPEAVAKIARDYLDRLHSQLRLVPIREQTEFLAEIESHIYEAYQQRPEEDEVARILAVLRNLGEPAEVVADRLPGAMARSGAKRSVPLYILGAVFIALFGIPLGFGGLGVLIGILGALAGMLIAFYATAGSLVLAGGIVTLVGLTRLLSPQFFDKLVIVGAIQFDPATADFLDHFSRSEQGLMITLCGSLILALGLGMFWAGRYMFRGLRFLFALCFDRLRPLAKSLRSKLRPPRAAAPRPEPSLVSR
jgi:uncharacterized membrane protein